MFARKPVGCLSLAEYIAAEALATERHEYLR
jgi:hypothetical protein